MGISITVLDPGRGPEAELQWAMPAPPNPWWRAPGTHGTLLRLRYALGDAWAEFVIDERGRRVWAGRSADVPFSDAAELLLGPVFSCVLAQRGLTCLHAGVVEFEGRTLAIVGPSGIGKSTLALALIRRGAALISDDVAVLREHGGRFVVCHGPPRLRVPPDSAGMLAGSFADLESVWAYELPSPDKRYLEYAAPSNGDAVQSHPLDIVYVIGPPSTAHDPSELRPLAPAEALTRLMANRHMVRVLDRDAHARDFTVLSRLAESLPVTQLPRPQGLGRIEPTAAAIQDRLRQLG